MSKINLPIKKYTWLRAIRRKIKKDLYFRDYFDKNKCVFVHIPKAAGTSVKKSLFPGTSGPGHRAAMEYLQENPKKFNDYFVFTFVRNPYDRLVSAYTFLRAGGKCSADRDFRDKYLLEFENFNDFVKNGLQRPKINNKWHFRPQHFYTVDFNGNNLIDFIGRVENIDEGFDYICERLGKDASLPHTNTSKRASNLAEYYDEKSKEIAKKFYKLDFELFGYSKELSLS